MATATQTLRDSESRSEQQFDKVRNKLGVKKLPQRAARSAGAPPVGQSRSYTVKKSDHVIFSILLIINCSFAFLKLSGSDSAPRAGATRIRHRDETVKTTRVSNNS